MRQGFKLLFIIVILQFLCIGLHAQNSNLTPVLNERTQLYGFKDNNGKLIVDYIYEEYTMLPDLICVVKNSKVGFINKQSGLEIVPCEYGYGNKIFGNYHLLYLNKNGLYGFVDYNTGKTIIPFIYEDGKDECITDLFSVKSNGKHGFISLLEHKEVIPTIYDDIKTGELIFDNGLVSIDNPHRSKIISAKKNGKWGFIDLRGKTIIPFIYDDDSDYRTNLFINGVAIVKKDNKYGLINETGDHIIPIKFKSILIDLNNLEDKVYHVRDFSDKVAIFSYTGKQLSTFYENITETYEKRAIFQINSKCGLVNLESGKEIIPAKYDEISKISENYARVKDGNLYGYVNTTTGEETFRCEFENGSYFKNGLCAIKNNGKWGYIKAYGWRGVYINCEYDEAGNFANDKLAVVRINNREGCLNTKGKLVIPCIYERISYAPSDKYFCVTNNPKHLYRSAKLPTGNDTGWGFLDTDGNEIIECKYTSQIAEDLLDAFWDENGPTDVDENIHQTTFTNRETFALIIANEDYSEANVENVQFAKKDGAIFKEYCQKTLGIPLQNIRYRENATLNNIRAEVNWISDIAKAYNGNAKIIFYYSGHGIPDEKNATSYLLPVDGFGSDARTAYSVTELYSRLGEIPSKMTTVFMDACFSGTKRDGDMMASARGVAIKAKPASPKGNMVVFSAAQGDQTAYAYRKKKHGMFTYFLLKKLQETNGELTLGELGNYITEQVMQSSLKENGKLQTPCVTASPEIADLNKITLR